MNPALFVRRSIVVSLAVAISVYTVRAAYMYITKPIDLLPMVMTLVFAWLLMFTSLKLCEAGTQDGADMF